MHCETEAHCALQWRDAEERADPCYVERMPVLLVQSARHREGQIAHWTGGELLRRLRTCQPLREKLQAPAWLPVRMREGETRRVARNIAAIWALVLDLDQDVQSLQQLWQSVRALHCEAIAHTTWSHTAQKPKARVVLPLQEECPAEKWAEVWAAAQRWAMSWGATIDPACKDPSRLYFLPAAPAERMHLFSCRMCTGDRISWRRLLCDYPQPKKQRRISAVEPTHAGLSAERLQRAEGRAERYAEAALQGVLSDLCSTAPGGRNAALWRAACRLGRLLAQHSSLNQGRVEQELLAAGQSIGLSYSECRKTIGRALRAGAEEVNN